MKKRFDTRVMNRWILAAAVFALLITGCSPGSEAIHDKGKAGFQVRSPLVVSYHENAMEAGYKILQGMLF